MQTREIPREQWVSFLDGFSRQHEGWLVNVQVTQDGTQNKPEARNLPLQGIAADLKHGDDDTIEIILGKQTDDYITHSLSKVKRIMLQMNDQGAESGLEFSASDGSKAVLQFRSSAASEQVDDVTSARR